MIFRPTQVVMQSGTPVKLQLAQTISSAHAHENDPLDFVVTKDVTVGGFLVIGTGARAEGTVVEVKGGRPLGIGGSVIISIDSLELTTVEAIQLAASKEFKGSPHIIRMAMMMGVTGAIYMPVAPAFLLSPGPSSTVLKGTKVTAYTKNKVSIDANELRPGRGNSSELSDMIQLLPSRVMDGEGAVTQSCRWTTFMFLAERRIILSFCPIPSQSSRAGITCGYGRQTVWWMAPRYGWAQRRTMSPFNW